MSPIVMRSLLAQVGPFADDADVGRVLPFIVVLDRAAGDRRFRQRPVGRIEQDVRGRGSVGAHAAFDIASADLHVTHFAAARHHAAAVAITDVAADDVRLMQVDVIVVDADAAVLIDVAGRDQHVAVALDQMNPVPALANDGARDGKLHRPLGLDAVGFGVIANDFEPLDHRRALAFPDFGFDGLRIRRAAMRADELDRRAGARHDDACRAVARERGEADPVEIDHDRFGDAIGPLGQMNGASAGVDRGLQLLGIVRLAVAGEAEWKRQLIFRLLARAGLH